MFNFTFQVSSTTINKIETIIGNLDPSLFQNIILGILAIFIPFAIVFLTDLLDSKKLKSDFEKMVLSDEVLGTKKVFWLSIFGLFFFSFITGKDVSVQTKIFSIFFIIIFIILFWQPFKKILKFSEGKKTEFEISFLKKLNFSNFIKFKNHAIGDKMIRAWKSFWSDKSEFNEREFTKIFISHINDAIKQDKPNTATQLSQTYIDNINKRDKIAIGYELLPKVFEWDKIFWEKEQKWLKLFNFEEKIKKFYSNKYFPTFKKWTLKLIKTDTFWDWNFFQLTFLSKITVILLKNGHGPYQLFKTTEEHVNKNVKILHSLENDDEKEKISNYINCLLSSFCNNFFNEIGTVQSDYSIWKNFFPKKWKITADNYKNIESRILLNEFLQWTHERITGNNEIEFDKHLSRIVNGLFPNVNPTIFPAFLLWQFSHDIEQAITKKESFYINCVSVSWTSKQSDKKREEALQKKEDITKKETIKIIVNYFSNWKLLKLYKEDLTEDENKKWKEFTEDERKNIIKKVRIKKFKKSNDILESEKIIKLCKTNKQYEYRRNELIELINELIKYLSE